MQDPAWRLMDSGFFDADPATGVLEDLDVNYPEGSRFWWRLHQVSPQQDRSLQLVFVPRIIGELMGLFGVVKVNRAKRTRAEFLKMLCASVTDDAQGIEFYSRELDVKQQIGNSGPTTSTASSAKVNTSGKAAKKNGIGANRKTLTCKGKTLTEAQAQVANTILQVGDQLRAPLNALVASIYAAMGESTLNAHITGSGGAQGAFQTQERLRRRLTDTGKRASTTSSTAGSVTSRTAARSSSPTRGTRRGTSPTRAKPTTCSTRRRRQLSELLRRAGGGVGRGRSNRRGRRRRDGLDRRLGHDRGRSKSYFMVNKGEDYWTAMNDLAQEVNWELIVDGNRIYYDADTELIEGRSCARRRRRRRWRMVI